MERAVSAALGSDAALQSGSRDRVPSRARDHDIGPAGAASPGGWRSHRANADDIYGRARRAAGTAAGHPARVSAAARGAAAALCLAAHAELDRAAAAVKPADEHARIIGRARTRRAAM